MAMMALVFWIILMIPGSGRDWIATSVIA